jgi:superfamily II DNA or RNA helicase
MNSKFSTFLSSFNPQTKGKQFEVFVKWFLENDPVWKSEVDKVWMWDDYPDRWGKDCGIDLVFRDKNNEIWAVQAKCYDREYPVTKSDVDKFLSESNRSLIQRRLLIATTDNLGPNAKKVCADQEKPVTLFLYSNFEDSVIDYPESISDLSRTKLKPKPQPRQHQIEAIEKVAKGFKDANKGQLIMACGTGKTFTTLWIKEKLKADLTLILLPSLSLLSQTLKEWTFGMNTPFKSLAVCSDETVSKGASEDQLLESVQDLSFPVTSDLSMIADFLNSSGNRVVFSTYQSSRLIADAQKKTNTPSFDLAIADEAHRCAGNVSSAFTTILNDDFIKTKLKLFATATPRTYSSNLKKQAEDLDFEIAGMDDEKVFGKEFHRLSFGEAIDRKLLTDYQLVIIGVDEPMIAELIKHRELLKTDSDEIIDAKSLAAEIGIIKAIKDYDLKRVLSFHSRVKSAEDFSKELPNVLDLIDSKHKPKGKLATGFVSGAMPTNYRRQKLEQLKELSQGDYAVLSNARCLSEGVDVPALDGIAIIDPKASQIDIVQTVGRAIRLSENKSIGTIILPVFIENGDDPEASIESTNFKPLWDVVKALRSHDEMLAFELDNLRTEMGKQKKRSVQVGGLKKIVIDVPQSVNNNFSNSLRTHLIEYTTASWNFWFGMLQNYKEEFGDTLVSQEYKTEDNYALGNWVNSQRTNNLSEEKIKLLDDIGFVWNFLDYRWEDGFKHLSEFKKTFGHLKVKKDYKSPDGYYLGSWTSHQRSRCRSGKLITPEQINKLIALGLDFTDTYDVKWEEFISELEIYKKEFKNLNISSHYKTPSGYELGNSIKRYRKKRKENLISNEKIKILDILGFVWEPKFYEKKWELLLSNILSYKKLYGDLNEVKREFKMPGGFTLGAQLYRTKTDQWEGKLDPEREKILSDLGFTFSKFTSSQKSDDSWKKFIDSLKEFKKKNGHCLVVRGYKDSDGYGLDLAINRIRTTKDQLTKDKIKELDEIGFVWDVLEYQWNEGFTQFNIFKETFHHTNVVQSYKTPNGFSLGSWLKRQRDLEFNDQLDSEKKQKLNSLGIIWRNKQ